MNFLPLLVFLTIFGFTYGSLGKLQPCLLEALKTKSQVDILIQFESTDQVREKFENANFQNHDEKANSFVTALKIHAENSQKPFLEFIESRLKTQGEWGSLWINNIIWVKSVDLDLIREIAEKSEVMKIFEDGIVTLDDPIIDVNQSSSSWEIEQQSSIIVEWSVDRIGAPTIWNDHHFNGTGVLVGIIDTGVYYDHSYLHDSYFGGNACWKDPYNEASPNSTLPNDNQGHGTHCLGTVLGYKRDLTHFIGVAPGAKWCACRGLNSQGSGTFANLNICLQYFVCPNYPDCSTRPHVVTNSWGGSTASSTAFDDSLKNMDAADILNVFANGNSGSQGCATTLSPSNSVNKLTAVGATDSSDTIAYFSSRGPDPQNAIKPHVSAPGVNINSCSINGADQLVALSGTSMATPHVAGEYALLRQKYPRGSYSNDFLRMIVHHQNTCFQPASVPNSCPMANPAPEIASWPNNHFGWGRVDLSKAFGSPPQP